MLTFKIPVFILFLERHVLSSHIDLINLFEKLSFRVYLSLLNCSGISITFFWFATVVLQYLLQHLTCLACLFSVSL